MEQSSQLEKGPRIKVQGRPAILGGQPAFSQPIAFNEPTLPPYSQLSARIEKIFSSGMLTNGDNVKEFEGQAADYFCRPVVAVSSCTSGLILAIKALGLTGRVILPSYTFFATAHALYWNGLEPCFVDIKPNSFTIDPAAVEEAITPEVSAVIGVDIGGNPCDRQALQEICRRHDLKLLIDAAHSFGGAYDGKPVGSFGDAEVFSLTPTKLVVAGEGGLISAGQDSLVEKLKWARDYGNPGDYNCRLVGLNARMAEVNAVVGMAAMRLISGAVRARNDLVHRYREYLTGVPGLKWQKTEVGCLSTFKDVLVVIEPADFGIDRDVLADSLEAENIPTKKYYWPPAHRQKAYEGRFSIPEGLDVTSSVSRHVLALPISSHMKPDTVKDICRAIVRIFKHHESVKRQLS